MGGVRPRNLGADSSRVSAASGRPERQAEDVVSP